jgi:hypothetical protein
MLENYYMKINLPSPHKRITYLKALPDELFNELRDIYYRCSTYVVKFNVPNEFVCDMMWPETQEEFNWIKREILGYYNLSEDEIQNLKYKEEDQGKDREDAKKATWFTGNVPDYLPNSLNFTRSNPESITEKHHGIVECKINIPIVNMGQACIRFLDTDERCWYPSPALLNIGYDHEVRGLERLQEFNVNERVFFQIVLNKPYQHYSDTLIRPNGW